MIPRVPQPTRQPGGELTHHERQIISHASSIAAADVLRVEEQRQVAVDLQKTGAAELHGLVGVSQKVHVAQLVEAASKLFDDVDAELSAEILLVQRASLQLQDHLADQP